MTAAITFDLDGLHRDLFVTPPTDAERARLCDVTCEVLIPRILEWLDRIQVSATFFAIGEDIERHPAVFRAMAAAGHEIANHTARHLRDFSRQPAAIIRSEIERGGDAIAAVTGRPPVGFRAPGYTVTPPVIETLTSLGYCYDASIVPSWSYTALKQAFRVFGRPQYRDFLVVQGVACAGAPRSSYPIAPGQLFAASPGASLLEIPITTIGPAQFPFIHGLTTRLPEIGQRIVERAALRRPFVSLAFHDFEFSDAQDTAGLPTSDMTRPHLATPIASRLERLTALVASLKENHAVLTMQNVAAQDMELSATVVAGQIRGASRS